VGKSGVVELVPGGVPLGLVPGATYRTQQAVLQHGDLLCLYSDGITEAASPDGEELGVERLLEVLRQQHGATLPAAIAAVAAATDEIAAGAPQADDQTLVLVRRHD
jgi:sigma-B regulation protein RsbU (phosphoserine phosphatase)